MLTRSGLILSSLILGQITISLCARLGLVVAFEPVQSASGGRGACPGVLTVSSDTYLVNCITIIAT